MRKVTNYPEDFKANILSKMMAPSGPSLLQLSEDFNIPYGTLHTWKMNMRKKNKITTPKRPKDKSAQDKLKAIIDTFGKTEEELGAYCRKNGINSHNLAEWKSEILKSLDGLNAKPKVKKPENKKAQQKIKELERNLKRKEKALAEVGALLVLKKKADLLWGEEEDD